jgi:hypothetical protein
MRSSTTNHPSPVPPAPSPPPSPLGMTRKTQAERGLSWALYPVLPLFSLYPVLPLFYYREKEGAYEWGYAAPQRTSPEYFPTG